jgi:hypothetical protein
MGSGDGEVASRGAAATPRPATRNSLQLKSAFAFEYYGFIFHPLTMLSLNQFRGILRDLLKCPEHVIQMPAKAFLHQSRDSCMLTNGKTPDTFKQRVSNLYRRFYMVGKINGDAINASDEQKGKGSVISDSSGSCFACEPRRDRSPRRGRRSCHRSVESRRRRHQTASVTSADGIAFRDRTAMPECLVPSRGIILHPLSRGFL